MRARIVPAGWAVVRGTSSRQLRHVSPQFVCVVLFRRLSSRATTVRRGLECLHMLGVLVCEETEEKDRNGKEHTVLRYRLADWFNEETLLNVTARSQVRKCE